MLRLSHPQQEDYAPAGWPPPYPLGWSFVPPSGVQGGGAVEALRTLGRVVDRLWTPWRMAFIESAGAREHESDCFLCEKAAADPANDRENLVVYRADLAYVLLNLYPYNSGHLMIAPYVHEGDLTRLDGNVAASLMALSQKSVAALESAYHPQGFNLGMNLGRAAGAGVPDHLHVHVVPRWIGDANFMPVVGETKVLPESLEQTYDRIRPFFA